MVVVASDEKGDLFQPLRTGHLWRETSSSSGVRVLGPALIQAEEQHQHSRKPADPRPTILFFNFTILFNLVLSTMESMDFAVEYDALIDLMVEGFEDTFGDKEL